MNARYTVIPNSRENKFLIFDQQLCRAIAESTEHQHAGRIANSLNKQLADAKLNKQNNKMAQALSRKEAVLKQKEAAAQKALQQLSITQEEKEKAANWDKLYTFLQANDMIPHYWE